MPNEFELMIDSVFAECEKEYGITFESDCCGYVRESAIYDAIAEYERSNIWD